MKLKPLLLCSLLGLAVAGTASADCLQKRDGHMVCSNDLVMDYQNDIGTVQSIFYNGQAQVRYDAPPYYGKVFNIDINNLWRATSCYGNVCVGQVVMDYQRDIGTVTGVFENAKATVRYDAPPYYGKVYTLAVSNLSPQTGGGYPHPAPAPAPYPQPAPAPYPQPAPAPYPQPAPAPYPQPAPYPHPVPAPFPQPNPAPFPGGHACYNHCAIGETCTDGCPFGAVCNYVPASYPYWRVMSCR